MPQPSPSQRSGDPIRSIVIVGGGTAGWVAAALLAKRLERQDIMITVVESSAIGTVGVGEATTPAIRDYFRAAELDEFAVMKAANATIKLGIRFDGWTGEDSSFFHPFGLYGVASNGVAFHHYWLKLRAAGDRRPIGDYCLATQLAAANRFMPPHRPAPDYAFFDWAVHFDAALFARHLASVARARGVRHVDARMRRAIRDETTGLITAIDTEEAGTIGADLFVDCTGFRSLLLGQSLEEPYVEWTDLLPCDRAVAMPCAHGGPLTPYTQAIAMPAGWRWRIPLQHRVGNGYVYSSRHLSDDEAVAALAGRLEGERLGEPNLIRFVTGRRRRFWTGNCVALGLAAGFLEPLESTSITLIFSGIERLLHLFPDRSFDPALAEDYNRITALEYERVRDFLLLHYWGARREEPLWRAMRDVELPEKLAHKVRMFIRRGRMVRYEWDAFQDPSWLSMFAGLDLLPERWDPLADYFPIEEVTGALSRIRDQIALGLKSSGSHEAFVERNFRADNASSGSR